MRFSLSRHTCEKGKTGVDDVRLRNILQGTHEGRAREKV